MKITSFSLLALAAALTVNCGSELTTEASSTGGQSSGGQSTGSTGTLFVKALRSPISPVETEPGPSTGPAPGVKLDVKDSTGKKIATIVTDDKGESRTTLERGTYRVEMAEKSTIPGPGGYSKDLPASVTITAGKETRLNVTIDTGIR